MSELPNVTVIIPCRNESRYIRSCLESIVSSDYPKECLEILVVDGQSEDGTKEICEKFIQDHPGIRLVSNPKKTTPAALNLGIQTATGEIIIRIDAHANYPRDYITKLVHWLRESGADNVGGVCRTLPGSDTLKARAIAMGLAHPFGVGNAYFRIGVKDNKWVDTVPFGCYHRAVFDRIGLFDEELVRNQDDEFNLRLIKNGGRILLVPEVQCDYFARDTFGKLWVMYYQYGYYKPLVVHKVGGVMTGRQLVPAGLVLSLLFAGLGAIFSRVCFTGFITIASVYLSIILMVAIRLGLRQGKIRLIPYLILTFIILHFSYGFGYLTGGWGVLAGRRA